MDDAVVEPARSDVLRGKVAVVTGASSGLGRRFAAVLACAGADVVVAARRLDRLEELAERHANIVPVRCDVAEDTDVEHLARTTMERFERVDVLVNNAGRSANPDEGGGEGVEEFRSVIDLNLVAMYRVTRAFSASMLERRSGSIVNVASILGLVASAPIKQASYTASKGAVVNLTRELAVQWARKGVRVNALAPGWFHSEMTESLFADRGAVEFIESNCPMGRFGREGELDGALLFLASDASSYCTGQILTIDGGWTSR